MTTLTHRQRLDAAICGEAVDRPAISFWRHFPVEDETAAGLAAAMVRWQRRYDLDFVKFMPTGTYGTHDWGAETTYASPESGTRQVTRHPITAAEGWAALLPLDAHAGTLAREVEAVRLAAADLDGSVPILQTIFSPLTTARKLRGDRLFDDLRGHPDLVHRGLNTIAETTIRFAEANLDAGATGFFFASQCCSEQVLRRDEHAEFGAAYDHQVLEALRPRARYLLLHVHGVDIYFDQAAAYPVDLLNWHDRLTWPTLQEAMPRFRGALVGGIRERDTLLTGPLDAIRVEIEDARRQTGGRRLVIGPGCVVPTHVPDAHLCALRAAVEG